MKRLIIPFRVINCASQNCKVKRIIRLPRIRSHFFSRIGIICFLTLSLYSLCYASCPMDHFRIGINPDGQWDTYDDNTLFADKYQIYRRSDPNNREAHTWHNRYYTLGPLGGNPDAATYLLSEPGFDLHNQPEHALSGTPNIDYRIYVECVDISPGFEVTQFPGGSITLDEPGDDFNHSALTDPHIHLAHMVQKPFTGPLWVTYRLYDETGGYEDSEVFSVVFEGETFLGDVVIDEKVDMRDLEYISRKWLVSIGTGDPNDPDNLPLARKVDYYERADTNEDMKINYADFKNLAENWSP